jgi:lysophospholipase L1-like esterase
MSGSANARSHGKPRKWRRRLLAALIVLAVLLVAGELLARFWFGLGDPILYVADPDVEYRFVPSSQYHRFGNTARFNQWSMRSDEFAAKKSDPNELRILALGDSIIFGGGRVGQEEMATSILQAQLRASLNRPVIVGNVSCNSWGPPNQLAYVKRFGWFDADIVILVFNSEDAADVPTFDPLPNDLTHKPWCALHEAVRAALPRARALVFAQPQPVYSAADEATRTRQSMDALRELVTRAREHGAKVIAIQHYRLNEIDPPAEGQAIIGQTLREVGVQPIQSPADPKNAAPLYFDDLHLNADGQRALAAIMRQAVEQALAE